MIYVYESGAYDYFLLAYISIFMRFSILKSYQLGQKKKDSMISTLGENFLLYKIHWVI